MHTGVGPLSSPVLLYQTALNAYESTPKPAGADETTPELGEVEVEAWVAGHPPWALCPRGLVAPSNPNPNPNPNPSPSPNRNRNRNRNLVAPSLNAEAEVAPPTAEVAAPTAVLSRTYHVASYPLAVDFVTSVGAAAEVGNHHPNLKIVHSCVAGVDVTVELFTYAVDGLTAFDIEAAGGIERIYLDGFT